MNRLCVDSNLYNCIFDENQKLSDLAKQYFVTISEYNSLYDEYMAFKNSRIGRILFSIRNFVFKFRRKKNCLKITNKMRMAWQKRHDFYIPYQAFGMKKKDFDSQLRISKASAEPVKFSILVPLYNTSEEFLKEMIASVLGQTYSNWELCLADASDFEHEHVRLICEQIAKNDVRIKYKRIEKNLGISANTNECLKIASGDYFSLLDHDDILHPAALFETYKMIESGADFIYSDELSFFSPNIHSIKFLFCKKDFLWEHLEVYNYICHFTTFSRKLLGDYVFDSDCDGAQDYDIILKLTERAKSIRHIKKILYYWRVHPQSTAYSTDAKSYASLAGKKTLEKHFLRTKQKVVVICSSSPCSYIVIRKDKNV